MAEFFQTYIRLQSSTGGDIAPPDLRPKLVEEALADETSLTEVVVKILSQAYGVEHVPTRRKSAPSPDGEELNVRLPIPLYRAVAVAAVANMRTVQREILAALCAYYGLGLPARQKHTRRRAAA